MINRLRTLWQENENKAEKELDDVLSRGLAIASMLGLNLVAVRISEALDYLRAEQQGKPD